MSAPTRPRPRSGTAARVDARLLARRKMLRRRRRTFALVVLLVAVVVVAMDLAQGGTKDPQHRAAAVAKSPTGVPSGTPAARDTPSPTPSGSASTAAVTYPKDGSGKFVTATGSSGVSGHGGTLLRFQIQVEKDIKGLDVSDFADQVTSILGAKQGWTAGGDWRFQRVGPKTAPDFVLHLVTPGTRDRMCHDDPDGYTSCRYRDSVMINVSRWVHGVPYYDDLSRYREYAISHEVGHRLGHGHQLCPGKGKKAPTMQQQTLGLHGCVPNPWPYPDGKSYHGPDGDYSQADIPKDPASYYTD